MVLLQVVEQEIQVETERRNKVDDVDRSENERALAGTYDKPIQHTNHQQFSYAQSNAHRMNVEREARKYEIITA